jgi:hypothetical protein
MEPVITRSSNSSPGSGRIASVRPYTFVAIAVLIPIDGELAAFRLPIRAGIASPQCRLSPFAVTPAIRADTNLPGYFRQHV